MRYFFLRASLLCTLALFNGCATPPPPAPDMTKLPEVAESIMSQTVYYSSLFNTCAKLGAEAEEDAITKQQDWLDANWKLIAGADAIYTREHLSEAIDYEGQKISPSALQLAQQAFNKAIAELNLDNRTPANQQKTCSFRMSRITPENISLASLPQVGKYQAALLEAAPLQSSQTVIGSVPRLGGSIALDIPPGKSYYPLIRALESRCANAYTLVIANNWPKEAYANFCDNKLTDIFICEWGNCTARPL